MRTKSALTILLFAICAACSSTSGIPGIPTPEERMPLAVQRAATDLACAESELTARYAGNRLFNVSGCGKHAQYRVICKIGVSSCYLIGGLES